jgi:hypothetical protein
MNSAIPRMPDNLLRYIRDDLKPLVYGTGIVGFCLGGYRGLLKASKRFVVESLHCTPKSRTEVNIFVRQRNNKMMAGFIKEGSKTGGKFIAVTMVFSMINFSFGSILPASNLILGDIMSSGITGGLLMALNGSMPKLYYIKRGLVIGSLAGLTLGLFRIVIE